MPLGESFSTTLQAARVGAEWAWAELYRHTSPPVLAYLRTRGAAEPEDLLGEVFLQTVRNLGRFEGDERQFRTWLLTIAHRRLIDEQRRRARRPVTPERSEVLVAAGPRGDAEQEGLGNLEVERIAQAIRRLSSEQQDVLLLRLLGELSVNDVASVLGKRPAAVRALQRRGVAALKKELLRERVAL